MTSKAPASPKRAALPRASDYTRQFVKDWADHRECHIGGDFLLIYRLDGSGTNQQVVFVRAGTHAELFG
jgi:addiction module RelE/StbE family toxin